MKQSKAHCSAAQSIRRRSDGSPAGKKLELKLLLSGRKVSLCAEKTESFMRNIMDIKEGIM